MKVGELYVQRRRCWVRPCDGRTHDKYGVIVRQQLFELDQNLLLKVKDAYCLETEHTFMMYDGSMVNVSGYLVRVL
jgi:hypothetical protein